jgi:Protein of unknown function (DUF433)
VVHTVAAGVTREEILLNYARLTGADIAAALVYAAELAREGTVDLPLETKARSSKSTKTSLSSSLRVFMMQDTN